MNDLSFIPQDAGTAEEAAAVGVELLGHVRVAVADVARGQVHGGRRVEQGNHPHMTSAK